MSPESSHKRYPYANGDGSLLAAEILFRHSPFWALTSSLTSRLFSEPCRSLMDLRQQCHHPASYRSSACILLLIYLCSNLILPSVHEAKSRNIEESDRYGDWVDHFAISSCSIYYGLFQVLWSISPEKSLSACSSAEYTAQHDREYPALPNTGSGLPIQLFF